MTAELRNSDESAAVTRSHWLNLRCETGQTRRITTELRDNPAFYDDEGSILPMGEAYLANLQGLTGSRRERWLLGLWTGVENAIYPHFDRDIHVRDLEPGLRFVDGAVGVDYGRRHKCGAVAISVDQYGRRWVREAWGEPADDHGLNLRRQVARLRLQYAIRRGRCDPLQDVLAGNLGFSLADGSPGSRNNRINWTSRLFNVFPGGRVPKENAELRETSTRSAYEAGPWLEPDCPGLLLVKGAPGIDQLAEQIESYHEVFQQSEVREDYVVARIDEDLVAAMEYGVEELEHAAKFEEMLLAGLPGMVRPR